MALGDAVPRSLLIPGDIWVANAGNNSLTEYGPGANGDAAPIATVSGPATILNMPVALGQDEHGNLLVANLFSKSVTRFPPRPSRNEGLYKSDNRRPAIERASDQVGALVSKIGAQVRMGGVKVEIVATFTRDIGRAASQRSLDVRLALLPSVSAVVSN